MKGLSGKNWEVLDNFSDKKISSKELVSAILLKRGLDSEKKIKEYLSPKDPKDIPLKEIGLSSPDVKKALDIIFSAIDKKEKIIIYGDYDADGITSTAILWEAIHKRKGNVIPYLPDRFVDGYGLNKESLERLLDTHADAKLLITADNGIAASEGVEYAKKSGIKVIVTDHHQKSAKLPKADVIIHTTGTSGAGVAWFLAREMGEWGGIGLAAIGIISDQIPLLGVNRSIVKYGLEDLNRTRRHGLLSLFANSGVKKGEITSYTVGFVIAPRLNAMGRLASAMDSLRLVCTKNLPQAESLAKLLGKTNTERQRVVGEVLNHAKNSVTDSLGFVMVAHESYHEGVIGLAASKLVEEYWLPAIVFSKGETVTKASARSIPGVNIFEVVKSMDKMLISGGGHEMAAGFSLETKNLDKFISKLSKLSKKYLTKEVMMRKLKIDAAIPFFSIDNSLLAAIKDFEPFGLGNSAPVFLTKEVMVSAVKTVGKTADHLKLRVDSEGRKFDAIGFGVGEWAEKIKVGDRVDIAYCLEENTWNGVTSTQLKLRDLRKCTN